jgi:hypothetical protein
VDLSAAMCALGKGGGGGMGGRRLGSGDVAVMADLLVMCVRARVRACVLYILYICVRCVGVEITYHEHSVYVNRSNNTCV